LGNHEFDFGQEILKNIPPCLPQADAKHGNC
jgi:hypothetical protein